MTNPRDDRNETDLKENTRRFEVDLFIVHPTLDPADITAALAFEGHFTQTVGRPRATPIGTPLKGTYRDTRWRHCVRYEVEGQWFAKEVSNFVRSLLPHKDFLKDLRRTGGRAELIIAFLDGYFGDDLPRDTLAMLVELDLDLGLEVFMIPQT